MTFTILVACSANVCRSPLVAAVLARSVALEEVGRRIVVITGGLDVVPGEQACAEVMKLAHSRGLKSRDLLQHRASVVTMEQIESSDLILAVDRRIRSGILKQVPQVAARAFTVREAAELGDHASLTDQVRGAAIDERLRSYTAGLNSRRGLTDLPRTKRVLAPSAPWRRVPVHAHDIPDAHQDDRAPHRVVYQLGVTGAEQLARGLTACSPTRSL